MHPLISDLSNLKDSEIEQKINDLTRKYFIANNSEVRHQITLILDTYKEELSIRRQATWQNAVETHRKDLDNLIHIN